MRVVVLGGGSWGTALAWLLSGRGHSVTLWCRDPDHAEAIRRDGANARYLPGLELPRGLRVSADPPAGLLREAELAVAAVPVGALRPVLEALRGSLDGNRALVLAAKGLEQATGLRVTEVAVEVLGEGCRDRLAVLSGPNLAGEVVLGMPASTVVASQNPDRARQIQAETTAPFFRVYTSTDVTGVELGGALKNPIAIAAGISEGLGFGSNAKAALVTRGLAEMTRLGRACGASSETFAGLSGIGDLIVTCESSLSRNHRVGVALGRGASLDQALRDLGQVAEGVPTCQAACLLADRLGIEVPIIAELRQVLFAGKDPRAAVVALMARGTRDEADSADRLPAPGAATVDPSSPAG